MGKGMRSCSSTCGFLSLILILVFSMAQAADAPGKKEPSDWGRVIEAAKKEGKLVISADPGEEWRKSLVDMFREEYPEITVEYTGIAGRNFWQRIQQERKLGQKLWDLRAGGMGTAFEAKKDGFLAPIRPLLLPEIADDNKWIGGLDGLFNDWENRFMPGYTIIVQSTVWVNRDFIKESELKSSGQLLDPRFKGKLVLQTPTGGATFSSLTNLAFMYGENFLRNLLTKQDVVITDDNRQQIEWLVRGRYPIVVGINNTQLLPFQKQGLGLHIDGLEDKINPVTVSLGGICLLKDPPHPNAARVYINWLLSKNTQIKLTKNVLLNSRRTDVPPVDKQMAVDPAHLNNYRFYSTEENVEMSMRLLPLIKESLKK